MLHWGYQARAEQPPPPRLPEERPITRTAERGSFLADIITTAVEGGVSYWAEVKDYRWYCPSLNAGKADPGPNGGGNAHVTLYDEDSERDYTVTPEVIATALGEIGGVEPIWFMTDQTRQLVRTCDRLNDAAPGGGDIDAAVADQILQVSLFGYVVYG